MNGISTNNEFGRNREIGVVGDFCVNAVTHFDKGLNLEKHLYIQEIDFTIGGASGLIASQIANLGGKAYAYGAVGNDTQASFIRSSLERTGVNSDGLETVDGCSGKNMILLGNGTRTVIADFGVHIKYPFIADQTKFKDHSFYFIPAYPSYLDLIGQTVKDGRNISTDIGFSDDRELLHGLMSRTLPLTNTAILSKEYMSPESFELIRQSLISSGGKVIITDGERGAYLIKGNCIIFIPAYKSTPIDVNSAGDTFTAGFLFAQSEGLNDIESINFAQAVAATKITRTGYIPTIDAINNNYPPEFRRTHLDTRQHLPLIYESLYFNNYPWQHI